MHVPDGLTGIVLEVADLPATRGFYDPIFRHAGGEWRENGYRLSFRTPSQRVAFVRRAEPATLPETGQHQAYAVPATRLAELLEGLERTGHRIERWREDRPAERRVAPYVHDPNGNRVQLVPGDGRLLDHVAVEVHDLEHAERFYVDVLGGSTEHYHGWRMEDYAEAQAWERGDDPCAPWTRRFDVRYWDKLRVARPNMQLFVRFGSAVVGVILATEHRPEPPEEQLRGTPRIVLRGGALEPTVARLRAAGIGFERDGGDVFLRDPGGNFVQLACAPS